MGIVIISKDTDFSAVAAEHIQKELAAEVEIAESPNKAKSLIENAQLIVTTETLSGKIAAPVITVSAPVRVNDMLAKLRARLKNQLPENGVKLGSTHQFFTQQKMVTHNKSGKTVDLTDKETQLLSMLLSAGKTVTKDSLLKDIWSVETELESHTLETHVYRLRAKLKDIGLENAIAAVPGGYVLNCHPERSEAESKDLKIPRQARDDN